MSRKKKAEGKKTTQKIIWKEAGLRLLTSTEWQHWIWWIHEDKSLKHTDDKRVKHHACFKSQQDFMPERTEPVVLQAAGPPPVGARCPEFFDRSPQKPREGRGLRKAADGCWALF